jgi:ComEC/Rec2-related protein
MLGGVSRIKEWGRLFVARHPLFAAALGAVACVGLAASGLSYGILTAGVFGLTGVFLRGWKQGAGWCACGLIAVGIFTWRERSQATSERALLSSASGEHRGRILADGMGNRYWSAPAELLTDPHAGAKVRWQGKGNPPVAGSIVTGRGSFEPLPAPQNPGEFNQAKWLRNQGIAAVFDASNIPNRVETGRFATAAARFRQGFRTAVTVGLEEESQEARVIRAIVIGEHPQDSEVLVAAFRNSGTLHAFSVSGLHVAMVGSIAWIVLRLLRVPRRWAILILIPLIFGYSWITGNSAPAVRSAWMAAVFLGAFVFRRRPDLLNALGAVLLAAMLWDGRLLFQPGVQLSYGVVAAISIGMAWANRAFAWMAQPDLYLPLAEMNRWQKYSLKFRRNLASSLGVSLAAGIGSTPLTAFHFGLVTPISIVAGIVLIPLVFVLLSTALLAAVVFPLAMPAARLINQVNGKIATLTVAVAEGFSAIPGGHFQVCKTRTPQLLVYHFDHGAAAACFSAGGQGAVLIDCADRRSFKSRLVPSLRSLGITPDAVVMSHPDGGHLGGGAAVWEAFPIRQALLPVERSRSPTYRAWLQGAPAAGIQIYQAAGIRNLPMPDGARLEVLHAPDSLAHNVIADERVAIFRLHWRGWKILFTSDAGITTELALLDSKIDLTSDVIVAGHHRTDLSLTDDFIAAVNPQAILPSHAAFPIEERLESARVAFWQSRKIHVIDPLKSGGVTFTLEPDGALRLHGFLDDSNLILLPR